MYRRIVFISGPYRAIDGIHGPFTPWTLKYNTRIAQHWAELVWKCGWAAICPHLNSQGMDGLEGVSTQAFIRGDLAILSRLRPELDIMLMLRGWRESAGSKEEFECAETLNLPISYAEIGEEAVCEALRKMIEEPD